MKKDESNVAQGLVIFDCDGVIADSEVLTMSVLSLMLSDLGHVLEPCDAIKRFRGRKIAECFSEIELEAGISFPDGFTKQFRERCLHSFDHHLKATPGIAEILQDLEDPYCIASSAPINKIRHVLKTVGLLHKFDGRIFSAYDINAWKPDPALFLHAAKYFKKAPEKCAVIEDSWPGISAGLAAKMTTFAFLAYSNSPDITGTEAIGFKQMSDLPDMLTEWRTHLH